MSAAFNRARAVRDGYAGEVSDAREYIADLTHRRAGVRR